MTWAHEDCDRPLRIRERKIKHAHLLKERLQEEEGMRKKAKEQLETQGAELEGARTELAAAQIEVTSLKVAFSNYWEDALMEVSRLQARAEEVERKVAEDTKEMVAAKTVVLSEYQSSAEFEQVYADNYDEGVQEFMYNVWHEQPE